LAGKIRKTCEEMHVSIAELTRRTWQSPQNLNAKLNRDCFTIREAVEIADALGIEFDYHFASPSIREKE